MSTSFWVIMQKRGDGKVYADLHKANEKMYLIEEDAHAALKTYGDLEQNFHVVEIVGMTKEEWLSHPHVETVTDILDKYIKNRSALLLAAGEMTAGELRTVRAVLEMCNSEIRRLATP